MSKKKITFIISCLYGHGGTNRVATLLANGLSAHHDITILSRYSHGNTYHLNSNVNDIKYLGNTLSFLLQCKRHIDNNKPDIVIVHTMSKLTPALMLVGINAKNMWSIEHTVYEFHKITYKFFRDFFYHKLNKVIVLTEKDRISYNNIASSTEVLVNPSSLTLTNNDYNKPSKTVLTLGRLAYEKGYDLLLKAWLLVEQSYPDWSLHIYGEGEDRGPLEKIIKDYNLSSVTLKGLTNNVEKVYDQAAFYVMSSRFEGFGMVLIEAQSRGLPIVSFNCPSGPAEIVHHNVDGILVENGNIQALASSMIKMMADSSLREAMAKQALQSAKKYQIDTIIEKWLVLIAHS